jgi:hypothetical protein
VIYFIQAGTDGPIKIGYASTAKGVEGRLRNCQVGNAEELHLRAVLPGEEQRERALHSCFRSGHVRGEWFRADTPGLVDLIEVAADSQWQITTGTAVRYCSWCQIRTVQPPHRRLCSDECATLSARGAGTVSGIPKRSQFRKEAAGA